MRYKPKALTDAIFFEKGNVYRDIDRTRTQRQVTNLNTFKYPNIDFQQDSVQSRLNTNIYLAAREKYYLNLNFDVSRSDIQVVGTAIGASVFARNVFGGAETLSFSLTGSIGILSDQSLSQETFTSEIGADVNLTIPRIWFPFNTEKIIPYYQVPQTRLSLGTNFQQNIGLDRQVFNTTLAYSWAPNNFSNSTLELLDIEFVRNTNPENFFNVYQNTFNLLDDIANDYEDISGFESFFETDPNDVTERRLSIPDGANNFVDEIVTNGNALTQDDQENISIIQERRDRLIENNFILSSNFSFQKDNRSDANENNFYQYRFNIESAGSLLSAFSSFIDFETDEAGQKNIFSIPFSQYIKTDFEYIKHWDLNNQNVLAFRGVFGLAVPFGNSDNIPFVRSYFAGGANDNRAWQVYSLSLIHI